MASFVLRLRTKGYVSDSDGTVQITREGIAALGGDYEPLPTGAKLRQYWMDRLPEGERKVLEILVHSYPKAIEREVIDASSSSWWRRAMMSL